MPDVVYIEIEDVLSVSKLIDLKVVDEGLLGADLFRAKSSRAGEDAYPTIERKAAAMFSSIFRNHAMMDGNKRTAWLMMNAFLELNGVELKVSIDEAFDFIIKQAENNEDLDQIEAFILNHAEPI